MDKQAKWKWQQGNWSVFPKKKYNEWHVAIPADNDSGMKVALFEDGVPGDTDEEKEALARLIGAAPDLLAVARQAYETLAAWTDILRQYAVTEGQLEELELALENAIFKAEPGYEP